MFQIIKLFFTLRSIQDHSWVVGITLLLLIAIASLKWIRSTYFNAFLKSFLNKNFFTKKFREKIRIEIPEVILFSSSLMGISLFVFILINGLEFSIIEFLQILFLLAFIILSKYIIEKIIGDLFKISAIINKYIFYKQSILTWLGLFYLFPLALLIYFQSLESYLFMWSVAGLLALVYIIKISSFLVSYQNYISPHWLYLILYICTFQIAPYLILFNIIKIN